MSRDVQKETTAETHKRKDTEMSRHIGTETQSEQIRTERDDSRDTQTERQRWADTICTATQRTHIDTETA